MPAPLRWHVFDTIGELTDALAEMILEESDRAVRANGRFSLVLAGGSTPRNVYRQLAGANADWNAWHIHFGDERCLPDGAAERNDTMVFETWLNHVAIPRVQIHSLPAETDSVAAKSYLQVLREADTFDLVLLGLGEDGHTASLFPGTDPGAGNDAPDLLAVFDAPKPPRRRVSLSARRLSRGRRVCFLVTGAGKRAALRQLRDGIDIPAAHIRSSDGIVDVYADRDALWERTEQPLRGH